MSIVETDDKKLTVIGKCAVCKSKIFNNGQYMKLHGVFFCVAEPITREIKRTEKWLADNGILRLIKMSNGQEIYVNPVQDRLTKRIDAHLA